MKLESIAIQEFKQFNGRLFIGDLQPGLNLFTGPNEAGKSTIAEAVRAVFLERYKASHLKDLLPWGKASGQPSVEVSFNLDGVACTLAKQFVTRQRCDLRIGQQVFGEDEAEDRLATLLGFSRATRGAMKADQAGVPGLLWVQQGETHDVRDASGHAALYLRDALTQLSGSTGSGGEDVLIGAVQRELRQLLTARTQRATGPLAEAEQALATLAVERDNFEAQRRQFDENLTRLATHQEAFEDAQRKRPWEAHEQKALQAQARAAAVAELERSVQGLAQTLQLSRGGTDALVAAGTKRSGPGSDARQRAAAARTRKGGGAHRRGRTRPGERGCGALPADQRRCESRARTRECRRDGAGTEQPDHAVSRRNRAARSVDRRCRSGASRGARCHAQRGLARNRRGPVAAAAGARIAHERLEGAQGSCDDAHRLPAERRRDRGGRRNAYR